MKSTVIQNIKIPGVNNLKVLIHIAWAQWNFYATSPLVFQPIDPVYTTYTFTHPSASSFLRYQSSCVKWKSLSQVDFNLIMAQSLSSDTGKFFVT